MPVHDPDHLNKNPHRPVSRDLSACCPPSQNGLLRTSFKEFIRDSGGIFKSCGRRAARLDWLISGFTSSFNNTYGTAIHGDPDAAFASRYWSLRSVPICQSRLG